MKFVRIFAAVAATLLVAACLFSPGKFDAQLTVHKDGTFSYRYTGEIILLTAHSAMMAMRDQEYAAAARFDPEAQACYGEAGSGGMGEDPGGDESGDRASFAPPPIEMPVPVPMIRTTPGDGMDYRPCTPEEIETKRREWDARQVTRRQEKERETAAMKAMLGGMDPSDPATMNEFARRLQGQGGWKKIVFKGEGVFEVDYQVSGRLDHDFVFPVFDGMDFIVPFVQATQSGAGRFRVSAPAFVKPGAGGGDRMGMSAIAAAAMMGKGDKPWPFKSPEGTFTLTTDASILTNNTRDGPTTQGTSKVLRWTITPLDTAKPEALIQF